MDAYGELLSNLDDLGRSRIAVVGDLMADRFIYGDAERLSPEAPVPVVRITSRATMPGGAANVARNILGFGGSMSLFGVLGNDEPAEEVERRLISSGADLNGVVRLSDRPTTVKTRVVARSQHMLRYDEEQVSDISNQAAEEILHRLGKVITDISLVVVSDYAKGVLTPGLVSGLKDICTKHGIGIIADPKPLHISLFKGIDVVKPNLGEAMRLVNRELRPADEEMEQFSRDVLETAKSKDLIITGGSRGMYVVSDGEFTHLPGFVREVYDVAGAGDTTLAAIALGLAGGLGLLNSARLGNIAGSIAVGKLGTAVVTMDEVKDELKAVADGSA